MNYLIHTPSDARELEAMGIDFEIVGPYDERRHWPMVISLDNPEEPLILGIIKPIPNVEES